MEENHYANIVYTPKVSILSYVNTNTDIPDRPESSPFALSNDFRSSPPTTPNISLPLRVINNKKCKVYSIVISTLTFFIGLGLGFFTFYLVYPERIHNMNNQTDTLPKNNWTVSETGCPCYWEEGSWDCACCRYHPEAGCPCPVYNKHTCVQCGQEHDCHTNVTEGNPWTLSGSSCECEFNSGRVDCACCAQGGTQCGPGSNHLCYNSSAPCDLGDQCGLNITCALNTTTVTEKDDSG